MLALNSEVKFNQWSPIGKTKLQSNYNQNENDSLITIRTLKIFLAKLGTIAFFQFKYTV